jgi:hypothetical protein
MKSRQMGAVASPEPLSRREICFYVRKTLTEARVLSFSAFYPKIAMRR